MVVDEGQGVVDDVDHVIEIDEEQRLGAHALDGEIDIADQNVGTRGDVNEIRDASVEVQLGGDAVDFQEDAIDAEIRNVEHDIVLRIFVRPARAARYGRSAGRRSRRGALSRQTVGQQSSIESTR